MMFRTVPANDLVPGKFIVLDGNLAEVLTVDPGYGEHDEDVLDVGLDFMDGVAVYEFQLSEPVRVSTL